MSLTKIHNRMTVGASVCAFDRNATGDGVTNDRAALVAAEAAGDFIDLPPGTYLVSSNLTLSKVLRFAPGAVLKPASGVTITLTGEIVAGHWQIFDISAGGTIAGPVRNQLILPDWWGAAPGVASDQSSKIQAALTFAQDGFRTVYLRNGLWRCDQSLYIRQACSLIGDPGISGVQVGSFTSTLDFSNAPASYHGLIVARTDFNDWMDGVILRDFAIYRSSVTTGAGGHGLILKAGSYCEVTNITIWRFDYNFSLAGWEFLPCSQVTFTGCRSKYAGTWHWDIHSAIDCRFHDCSSEHGPATHGMKVYELAPATIPNALYFENCLFVMADATYGMAIYSGFWHTVTRCVFEGPNDFGIVLDCAAVDMGLLTLTVQDCWFNDAGCAFGSIGLGGNIRLLNNRMEKTVATFLSVILIDSATGGAVERDIEIAGNNIRCSGATGIGIGINRVIGAFVHHNRIWPAVNEPGIVLYADTESCAVTENRTQTVAASAAGIENYGTANVLTGNTKY